MRTENVHEETHVRLVVNHNRDISNPSLLKKDTVEMENDWDRADHRQEG